MFSAGEAYEWFMGRWSRVLATRLVPFAGVQDGDTVLDVGSGTGALADAVAAAAPSTTIVGIDPSEPFIALARQTHRSDRVRFEVGDATQLPFPDHSFDRTLSLLILNFIPQPARAVSEMRRVTRPDGTVAAAVWDYADGMEMLRVFWEEAVALDPAASLRDERRMPLCQRGELGALWRSHHVQDVVEAPLTIEMSFTGFDDYWTPFVQKQGPAGAYVATLSENAREQLRQRLRRRLIGDGAERPFVLQARAWAVRGLAAGSEFQAPTSNKRHG